MYLNFEEYKNFGGTLDEAAFNRYGYEAEKEVFAAIHNRKVTENEAVKRCICKILEIKSLFDLTANIKNPKVSSFSHDGLSQSFALPTSAEAKKQIKDIIYSYLIHETDDNGTPLLYCGVKS